MTQKVMPEIDHDSCIMCGDCIASCPSAALSVSEETVILDEEQCVYCGDCEDICPQGAIRLPFEILLPDHPETEGKNHE